MHIWRYIGPGGSIRQLHHYSHKKTPIRALFSCDLTGGKEKDHAERVKIDRVIFLFNKNEPHIPEKLLRARKRIGNCEINRSFLWSVELFWNRFLFLAFVQEFYSKATSIIKRQNASVNKKSVVFFTSKMCGNVTKNCAKMAVQNY